MRTFLMTLAVALCLSSPARAARGGQVKVLLQYGGSRSFEHRTTLDATAALRLSSPSPADLKVYLELAQRALADKLGYGERVFGGSNYTLAGNRLVRIEVLDESSRVVYTYRPRVRRGRVD